MDSIKDSDGSQPSKKVSPSEVKHLYKQYRKAGLKSKSLDLRRQEYEHIAQRVKILDVPIDNISVEEFLSQLSRGVVFTPNVDHLMKLRKDNEFVSAYRKADYRICDSQILLLASKFLGTPIKAKISGSDLLPLFCEHHKHNKAIKIFLLGGTQGVAARAKHRINSRIGREIVVQAHSPSFGFERNKEECEAIVSLIQNSPANVLIVGLGAPKQEIWIDKYKDRLQNIDIFMALGASIDFEAGHKPRAPKLISSCGLEWLYRLLTEPSRLWKRYLLDDLPFLWLIILERLRKFQKKANI